MEIDDYTAERLKNGWATVHLKSGAVAMGDGEYLPDVNQIRLSTAFELDTYIDADEIDVLEIEDGDD